MTDIQQPQHIHSYFPPTVPTEDEIDLRDLFVALWRGKWIIIVITFAFSVGGILYALSQPNIYQSSATLMSSSSDGKSGLAGMASRFGGLASLAGVNLGSSGVDDKTLALATLNSRVFINYFINKHDLLIPLLASTDWDASTGYLVIDEELYDTNQNKWTRDVEAGKSTIPTDWEAFRAFKKVLSTSESKEGLVILSVTHLSPTIAQQWAVLLIQDLNVWMKEKSLNETKRNIGYLNQQLNKTNVADMRTVFYQLIEEQTKNLMLAEVEDEFSFKIIDPPVIPEEKVGPKRALICILATLLGAMLGAGIVIIRFAFKKS